MKMRWLQQLTTIRSPSKAAAMTESKQVDVLEIMDRLIGNARTMAGLSGDPVLRQNIKEGEQARAAVAEVFEASQEVYRISERKHDAWDRLCTALRNAGVEV